MKAIKRGDNLVVKGKPQVLAAGDNGYKDWFGLSQYPGEWEKVANPTTVKDYARNQMIDWKKNTVGGRGWDGLKSNPNASIEMEKLDGGSASGLKKLSFENGKVVVK